MSKIEQFKSLLESGNNNALLRYSLANEYYKIKKLDEAILHLEKAIELKKDYSAAWKLYAKVLAESGDNNAAINAYKEGIAVAEKNGDKQAVKEMTVFLKRLESNND